MKKGSVFVLVVCGALAALPGCHDDTKCRALFDRRCQGQVLEGCRSDPEGVKFGWVAETDCGPGFCVEAQSLWRGASCALEPQPRPACGTAMDEHLACDGAQLLLCVGGYVVGAESCASPDLCAPTVTRCLARPGQDAACPPDGSSLECAGTSAIDCVAGYRSDELECGSAGCSSGRCLAAGVPDPRCQDGALQHGLCAGNVALECDGEYLVRRYECGVYLCDSSWTWSPDRTGANGCDHLVGWGNN